MTKPFHSIASWIHTCLEIDSKNNIINFSIKNFGQNKLYNITILNPVPKLNLYLGVIRTTFNNETKQFLGKVSNINVFDMKEDIKNLKDFNSCSEQGNFMSWKDMKWQLFGNVTEEEETEETICGKSYILQLPLLWNFSEARMKCSKMGNGRIATLPNPGNVSDIENYFGKGSSSCDEIWTPYSGKSFLKAFVYPMHI